MSEKPAVSNRPNAITYFRPGQLVFHVNENMSGAPEKIQEMMNRANKFAGSNGMKMRLSPSKAVFDFDPAPNFDLSPSVVTQQKEVQHYPELSYVSPAAKPPTSFSLVAANVQHDDWAQFPTEPKDQAYVLEQLLDLAMRLDENLDEIREEDLKSLVAVSPNWLMSGSPSSPETTGGPGGRPSPYSGSASTDNYNFDPEVKQVIQKIRDENIPDRGDEEKVVVAILDTAPMLREGEDKNQVLGAIYEEWVNNPPNQRSPHSLIKTLLGPNARLQNVYFDDEVDKPIPGVWQDGRDGDGYIMVDGHDYEMTDHGLFAAGIIHSLAPQAELHLFQVLNRYGVGDLLSIARALKQIHDDNKTFPKNRLVVNLSLTINIPLEKAQGKSGKVSDDIRANILKIKDNKVTDQRTVQTIEWICDSLYAQGAKVIAAAGNNGESNHRPQACYPAAFENVLGVGALPIIREKPEPPQKKVKTAKYSNRSDRPEWTGVTTLGGEDGEEHGVLGIYVGKFPEDANGNRKENKNGWAWWAGTSFATPIITGMTAAVRGVLPAGDRVENAVVKLLEAQKYTTEDFDEDVFWVKQLI